MESIWQCLKRFKMIKAVQQIADALGIDSYKLLVNNEASETKTKKQNK